MKLRKMMLNINGVDRMFMCDPENDKTVRCSAPDRSDRR